ncbi:MAG: glycosyltransferase family 4 protein [Geobacteraceae bacterium]|nr:glycosyltransferase family 4 protein [Geobacteraceae bacterium]
MLAPTPYFVDRGCHVRIYEEARALKELGQEVLIVTYHLGRDMPGIKTCRIPRVAWYRKLSAGPSWHKPCLDILLLFTALRAARKFRPDIIHAHLHEGAFIGILLKKFLPVPLLFDCQGSLTAELIDHGFVRRGSPLYRLFGFLERFINRRADFIITSSGPGAETLRNEWGVNGDRLLPLMDGVNSEEFRPLPREEARRALNLPLEGPVAVFLGVLNRYQGVDLLLEAIRILREKGSPVRFLVMGFPEEKYRRLAEQLGLGEAVTFTGRVDYAKAPLFLSAGDIALSPKISRTEANGKLFNYMACGLPTVVFDTPINREILGDAGVYAAYGDPADLAAKIEALAGDGAQRERLAARMVGMAAAEHSWQARGMRLLELYRLLLSRQGKNDGKVGNH